MDEDIKTGIPAIIEAARASKGAEIIDIIEKVCIEGLPSLPLLIIPGADGSADQQSLLPEVKAWRDEFATKPRRRVGTAALSELDSFIAHAVRFKDEGSAVFLSGSAKAPKFTSVLDYHPAGKAEDVDPRFGHHRGVYVPAFSPEWSAWLAADRQPISQAVFADLITTNVRDVCDVADGIDAARLSEAAAWYAQRFGGKRPASAFYASAQRLLDLSEGLTTTVTDRVGDVARRDTGEVRITFESATSTDLEIPVAFLIEIPVFLGGDPYQIPVRLRFALRTEGDTKRAQWRIEMFGADRTVLAVVEEMRKKVETGTGLPVFAGVPE